MDTIIPSDKTKGIITYSFLGIATYIISDTIHEVIGHAGTSLLLGYKIELLTSVYYRSRPESMMVSLGGPLANLLFALLLFTILVKKKDLSILLRFLIVTTMAYNLFWFSGTLLQSVISKTGDWNYFPEQYFGPYGFIFLIFAGITAYYLSGKLVKLQFNDIENRYD